MIDVSMTRLYYSELEYKKVCDNWYKKWYELQALLQVDMSDFV